MQGEFIGLFKKMPRGSRHPVFLRIGTTYTSVYRQIVLEQHYDFALRRDPRVIVDAASSIRLDTFHQRNSRRATIGQGMSWPWRPDSDRILRENRGAKVENRRARRDKGWSDESANGRIHPW